mmetsp:Transcript_11776/g.29783  ORF Transcript_11776/g.29783 Transcript_11776/m.29783 type:complete len:154 (+) Transcript_11776:581-1042(+)
MGVILNSGEVTVTCGGACQQPNLAFSGTTEDAAINNDPVIEPEFLLGETSEDIDVPPFSPSALSAVTIDNDNLLGAPLAWRVADERWRYDQLMQTSNGGNSDSGNGGDGGDGGDSNGSDSNGGGMLDDSDDNGGSMGEPACTESTLTSRDNCP